MSDAGNRGRGAGRSGWRDRRPTGGRQGGPRDTDGAYAATPRAPSMARSRIQLASTYAPGTLFTWEGAKGICRAVPLDNPARNVSDATRLLIFNGIKEFCSNWNDRASQVRNPAPSIQLILDDPFYDLRSGRIEPDQASFQLTDPGRMGYVPYPLLYRCGVCGRLKEYGSIQEQARHPLPRTCNGHDARWTQVDVVYVHWSGHLEPLSPYKNNYDANRGVVSPIDRCTCGSQEFRLNNASPTFSDWSFVCERCRRTRDIVQKDPLTWEILERERAAGGRGFEFVEINMLPVSYRANSAYYPQKISFIEFRDRSVVDLLLPESRDSLTLRLAQLHGFAYSAPSDHEIQDALTKAGKPEKWAEYMDLLDFAQRAEGRNQTSRATQLRQEAAEVKETWYADGLIQRGQVQSAALIAAVQARNDWARRYDPIRLSIEHDRFRIEHIDERREKHEAVDVLQPDRLLCDAVGDPAALERYRAEIGGVLANIGIGNLTLIRGLPICESSFGFTRVSSTPVHTREINNRAIPMPVRLNAFPRTPEQHHPIYVTQQRNESLYFQVDQDRVRRWLVANGVADLPDGGTLGAAYLERYSDFGPYLEAYKGREGRGQAVRGMCSYIYMLLHTLAHQAMHSLADVSGLDRDALGEYIFPADLSFVIYRKGMTPDLGNVSAMWRNHGADFLRRMLDPRLLRCGSGSLCDTRGGACPACVMIAEVTCIASNQLLSRASLKGGPPPNWEPAGAPQLIGFYDPTLR